MCVADRQTGTIRFVHSDCLRHDRAIADRVGRKAADLHVAFVADVAFRIDVALGVVRIHRVGGQADGIVRDVPAPAIVLRHHVIGDHPPRLADIELMRPIAVVDELVLGQAPAAEICRRTFSGTRGLLANVHIRPSW